MACADGAVGVGQTRLQTCAGVRGQRLGMCQGGGGGQAMPPVMPGPWAARTAPRPKSSAEGWRSRI